MWFLLEHDVGIQKKLKKKKWIVGVCKVNVLEIGYISTVKIVE